MPFRASEYLENYILVPTRIFSGVRGNDAPWMIWVNTGLFVCGSFNNLNQSSSQDDLLHAFPHSTIDVFTPSLQVIKKKKRKKEMIVIDNSDFCFL